jgi:ATP-dependent DNA helicase RecG
MLGTDLREGETLELKSEWSDDALKDLAAFANTRGGTLVIGIANDGSVIGTDASDQQVQRLANLITSRLGITPSIRVESREGKPLLIIQVDAARGIVPYSGRYLKRVGSTNRDFALDELARHLLQRSGQSWDALPSPYGLERVNPEAIATFARLARNRLPHIDPNQPRLLLQNLELLKDDCLTNAGLLLFGVRPQEQFVQARLRIGVFRSPIEVVDSHEFVGTLWEQLEGAMERFRRLLQVRFEVQVTELSLEGLARKDVWEYPLEALREAVINALIHRDYTSTADIQIRVYDDELSIWNPGGLPPDLRIEQLREPQHPSMPRNPLLAQAFYYAGQIERWGTGTARIFALCREQGLPEPEFDADATQFCVRFLKDPYTPERLRKMGLNERQVQAVLYVKAHGSITNKEYQQLTGASKPTATRDLENLTIRGILERRGVTGRGTQYTLKGSETAQTAHKRLTNGSKGYNSDPS